MKEYTPSTYKSLVDKIKSLESEKKAMREALIESMDENNEYSRSDEQSEVKLSRRSRVKYDLEGISTYLSNLGIPEDQYTTRTIDLSKVEALLADGQIEAESLVRFATVEYTNTLTVKGVKNERS